MPDTFQDRVAQFVLAVLYTSNHIDVTLRIRGLAQLKDEHARAAKGEKYANRDVPPDKQTLSAKQLGQANAAAKDQHLQLFEQGKAPYAAGIAQHHPGPEIGPVFHLGEAGVDPTTVSEIDQDTVAIVIGGDTLYAACNYKIRRSQAAGGYKEIEKMAYLPGSFDSMSQHSLRLIKEALLQELRKPVPPGAPTLPGEELADGVRYVCVVGLEHAPTNAFESAEPHAEMQLLNYLDTTGRSVEGLYWGVSKECCSQCADVLDARQARYGRKHTRTVQNWRAPSRIATELKDTLVLA